MGSEDKIRVILNVIFVVAIMILISIAITSWIWPTAIPRFVASILD